ncbi:hypothetical protein OFM36_40120, partial [Escherichia coli]|nr:hypothetical protein [Escherichia coli]
MAISAATGMIFFIGGFLFTQLLTPRARTGCASGRLLQISNYVKNEFPPPRFLEFTKPKHAIFTMSLLETFE